MEYDNKSETNDVQFNTYISDNDTILSESTISIKRKGFSWRDKDSDYFRINEINYKLNGYSTLNIPGFPIRNAITGHYEINSLNKKTFRVGTLNENIFFSAIISMKGYNKEMCKLFYISPEQCERHLRIKISNDEKLKWRNKKAKYINN